MFRLAGSETEENVALVTPSPSSPDKLDDIDRRRHEHGIPRGWGSGVAGKRPSVCLLAFLQRVVIELPESIRRGLSDSPSALVTGGRNIIVGWITRSEGAFGGRVCGGRLDNRYSLIPGDRTKRCPWRERRDGARGQIPGWGRRCRRGCWGFGAVLKLVGRSYARERDRNVRGTSGPPMTLGADTEPRPGSFGGFRGQSRRSGNRRVRRGGKVWGRVGFAVGPRELPLVSFSRLLWCSVLSQCKEICS